MTEEVGAGDAARAGVYLGWLSVCGALRLHPGHVIHTIDLLVVRRARDAGQSGSGRSSVVEHLLPKHPALSGVRQIASP